MKKKTKPKPRPKYRSLLQSLAVLLPWTAAVLVASCAGTQKPTVEQVSAEAERLACYAAAAASSERTLRDLCPVHGTEAEKREQTARCAAGPEILHQLELKLEKCDGFGI